MHIHRCANWAKERHFLAGAEVDVWVGIRCHGSDHLKCPPASPRLSCVSPAPVRNAWPFCCQSTPNVTVETKQLIIRLCTALLFASKRRHSALAKTEKKKREEKRTTTKKCYFILVSISLSIPHSLSLSHSLSLFLSLSLSVHSLSPGSQAEFFYYQSNCTFRSDKASLCLNYTHVILYKHLHLGSFAR